MGREVKRRVTKPFRRCGPMAASESRAAGDNATSPEHFACAWRRERMPPTQRMAQAGLGRSESGSPQWSRPMGRVRTEGWSGLGPQGQASAKPTTAAHKRRLRHRQSPVARSFYCAKDPRGRPRSD